MIYPFFFKRYYQRKMIFCFLYFERSDRSEQVNQKKKFKILANQNTNYSAHISYENMNQKSTKSNLMLRRMGLMLTVLQQLQSLAIRQLLQLVHLLLSSSKSRRLRRFHIAIACQRMRSTLPQYQRHVTNSKKYFLREIFLFFVPVRE